jgi:hypothetical protein
MHLTRDADNNESFGYVGSEQRMWLHEPAASGGQ